MFYFNIAIRDSFPPELSTTVRISLKEIESLTYNITKPDQLKGLQADLEKIKRKYSAVLPSEEGLTLRSFTKLTRCSVTARKLLKLKYKRLQQRTAK